ncbi:MAG: DsbA family protein [Ilumatobacteraceae bacterium]
MADLEFFFDPICPWAWVTSRWVAEVQQLRDYDVQWRFISLKMINEARTDGNYGDKFRAGHMAGLYSHRVCDEVRIHHGNVAVGAMYAALGDAMHTNPREPKINDDPAAFMTEILKAADLPTDYASHVHDESHDAYIREDTEVALSRTGRDVGTPIITFHPGQSDEGSFFGPVISTIPRGQDALKLWDAIEIIATQTGMSELKRSNRAPLNFN